MTIILPECSSDDVTAILGVIVDVNSTATEIDANFVEKYYWIDVEKIASDRGKISANVDCADQQRFNLKQLKQYLFLFYKNTHRGGSLVKMFSFVVKILYGHWLESHYHQH